MKFDFYFARPNTEASKNFILYNVHDTSKIDPNCKSQTAA